MTEQVTKWVILEAMGHRVAAGRYFVENGLHRVDIPDVSQGAEPETFIRSEWYGNAAIFCITPVTEEAARLMAGRCVIPEAIPWDVRQELTKMIGAGEDVEARPMLPRGGRIRDEEWDNDDDYPYDETSDYEDRLEDTEEQDGYIHS
jgi:hypothetical protein